MSKSTKRCKVCGKEYESCHTPRPSAGVDRWQDVACCIQHAATYFAEVYASRAGGSEENTPNDTEEQGVFIVDSFSENENNNDTAVEDEIAIEESEKKKPKRNKQKNDNE